VIHIIRSSSVTGNKWSQASPPPTKKKRREREEEREFMAVKFNDLGENSIGVLYATH
jgi:hypothetical protein